MLKKNVGWIALSAILVSTLSGAQTKDQCRGMIEIVSSVTKPLRELDKAGEASPWDPVAARTSGKVKSAAEAAKRAHAEYVAANRKYLTALEELNYQFQLCAR
jgi:hypothetical protein